MSDWPCAVAAAVRPSPMRSGWWRGRTAAREGWHAATAQRHAHNAMRTDLGFERCDRLVPLSRGLGVRRAEVGDLPGACTHALEPLVISRGEDRTNTTLPTRSARRPRALTHLLRKVRALVRHRRGRDALALERVLESGHPPARGAARRRRRGRRAASVRAGRRRAPPPAGSVYHRLP